MHHLHTRRVGLTNIEVSDTFVSPVLNIEDHVAVFFNKGVEFCFVEVAFSVTRFKSKLDRVDGHGTDIESTVGNVFTGFRVDKW